MPVTLESRFSNYPSRIAYCRLHRRSSAFIGGSLAFQGYSDRFQMLMSAGIRQWVCGVLMLAASAPAAAAEFRSVADNAAVLYDAPSVMAKKLHILGRNYPVEVVVKLEGWTKIRDASGELAWIEAKNLGERRSVMVTAKLADVRQAADDKSTLVFQAEQYVLLDLVGLTGTGWAQVTHRDGQSGYIRLNLVWGI
jgi:SH3-like domain-containing protein